MSNEDSASLNHNIEKLSERVARQVSGWYALRNGIAYGMGFVIGSILATSLIVSVFLQFFSGTVVEDVIYWFANQVG